MRKAKICYTLCVTNSSNKVHVTKSAFRTLSNIENRAFKFSAVQFKAANYFCQKLYPNPRLMVHIYVGSI